MRTRLLLVASAFSLVFVAGGCENQGVNMKTPQQHYAPNTDDTKVNAEQAGARTNDLPAPTSRPARQAEQQKRATTRAA